MTRRDLIKLKRAIFNNRMDARTQALCRSVGDFLPGALANTLHHWQHATAAIVQAWSDPRWTTLRDAAIGETLAAAARNALFSHAMSETAVSFWTEYRRRVRDKLPTLRSPSDRRSALSYVNRACRKTSPLSSFMAWSAVTLTSEAGPLATASGGVELRRTLTQPYRYAIRLSAIERCLKADAPAHARVGEAVLRDFQDFGGYKLVPTTGGLWRRVGRSQASEKLDRDLVVQLPERARLATILDLLARSDDPAGWLRFLIVTGRIQLPQGEQGLLGTRHLIEGALELDLDTSGLSDLLTEALTPRFRTLTRGLPALASKAIVAGPAVYPRSLLSGHQASLNAGLRARLGVNPIYRALVTLFEQEFGAAGTCRDVYSFLINAANQFAAGVMPAVLADVQLGRTALSVMAQPDVACDRLVINRIYPFPIWQALRGRDPETGHALEVQAHIRDWLGQVADQAQPIEISCSADCNDLQNNAAGVIPTLSWGYEGREPGSPRLRDLVLSLSPDTRQFIVTMPSGQAAHLFYLGGLVPAPHWGWEYLLTILCNPAWIRPTPPLEAHPECISHRRAMSEGRVIFERETWIVPTVLLTDALAGEYPNTITRLIRLWLDHDLPLACYVCGAGLIPGSVNTRRNAAKPTYIEVDNPVYHEALSAMATEYQHLTVRPVDPEHGSSTTRLSGHQHTSELLFDVILE